jgi:hypothetical protein
MFTSCVTEDTDRHSEAPSGKVPMDVSTRRRLSVTDSPAGVCNGPISVGQCEYSSKQIVCPLKVRSLSVLCTRMSLTGPKQ